MLGVITCVGYAPAVDSIIGDERTREFWETGRSGKRPHTNLRNVARRKLEMIDAARVLDDPRQPPNNKLHSLTADRGGQHAIWINAQFRVCFRWRDGDAFEVRSSTTTEGGNDVIRASRPGSLGHSSGRNPEDLQTSYELARARRTNKKVMARIKRHTDAA